MSASRALFLLNDIRKLDKAALPLMVDRYTALAHPTQADLTGIPIIRVSRLILKAVKPLWKNMV